MARIDRRRVRLGGIGLNVVQGASMVGGERRTYGVRPSIRHAKPDGSR
jgi:hypothetical protein